MGLLVRAGLKAVRMPMAASRTLGNAWPGLREVALPALGASCAATQSRQRARRTRSTAPLGHADLGGLALNLADTKPMRQAVEGATVHDIAVSLAALCAPTWASAAELPTRSDARGDRYRRAHRQ